MVTSNRESVLALKPWGSLMSEMTTSPGAAGIEVAILPQEFSRSCQNRQTYLPLNVMGVHGEFLAGFEIEVEDLEVGRVMHYEPFHALFGKIVSFEEIDLLHGFSPLEKFLLDDRKLP